MSVSYLEKSRSHYLQRKKNTSNDNLRKDEEVVGRCHSNRVLVRVPRCVQDLLGKVNRLDVDVVLLAVLDATGHHLVLGRSNSLGLERALVRLERHIILAVAVINIKVVVV